MADKRKQPPASSSSSKPQAQNGRDRKRAKTRDARAIATQSAGTAFRNGEVDVDKFVRAREFEIRALEAGMRRARHGLTTRAFQSVPKELRRRTASHNVKRVPKRLRRRAACEMAEDNTPTVTARRRKVEGRRWVRVENARRLQRLRVLRERKKAEARARTGEEGKKDGERDGDVRVEPVDDAISTRKARVKTSKLKNPPAPPAKFRKRQMNKQWLPTHMYHAKRAHMTPPLEPLWRFAIPLAPTMKCYRPTHRASTARGAVAWDMSYMSTIGLHGSEEHLAKLLKDFGVDNWDKRGQKWRDGARTWEGWLYEKGRWPTKPIAPVTVIWCAKPKTEDVEMEDAAGGSASSKQKERRHVLIRIHPSAFLELWDAFRKLNPPVTMEDLRWEIGSIEITGPGATEALRGVLWPIASDDTDGSPSSIWKQLAPVTNLGTLPANPVLGFEISDPRLHHPPRTVDIPTDSAAHSRLVNTLATWAPDRTQGAPSLFSRKKRLDASRSLPSQKSINRRKAAAMPNAYPEPRATDPAIPVLLFATRTPGPGSGTWTLLLPWKCVSPVWNSLMYYPLSTGANVRLGGLNQKRQLAFEAGVPFFPADFPGTKAGREWNERENGRRKEEWERRPRGRRIEFDSLQLAEGRRGEVGKGWACDWEALQEGGGGGVEPKDRPPFYQLPLTLADDAFSARDTDNTITDMDDNALANVSVTMLARGTPKDCARIYRLPLKDKSLRDRWLDLLAQASQPAEKKQRKAAKSLPRKPPPPDAADHVKHAFLAANLLAGDDEALRPGRQGYPPVPGEEDLVGFVTAGNFNLGEGRATAVGSVVLKRLVEVVRAGVGGDAGARVCVVRNAGEAVGRLARWEIV